VSAVQLRLEFGLEDREPIRMALNLGTGVRYPVYDENETHILVIHPKNGKPIWSPKEAWRFDLEAPSEAAVQSRQEERERHQAFRHPHKIIDYDAVIVACLSDEELDGLKSGELQVFYDRWLTGIGRKRRDQGYGWCLVTKTQRSMLLDEERRDLNNIDEHMRQYGQASWQEWTNLRVIRDPVRQYALIRRTPIILRKRKGVRVIAKKKPKKKKGGKEKE